MVMRDLGINLQDLCAHIRDLDKGAEVMQSESIDRRERVLVISNALQAARLRVKELEGDLDRLLGASTETKQAPPLELPRVEREPLSKSRAPQVAGKHQRTSPLWRAKS